MSTLDARTESRTVRPAVEAGVSAAPPSYADDLLRLDRQVCFSLVVAARSVVALYRPVLEPLGLTHPQYLVMLALWEGAPLTIRQLGALLSLEPATVSPLVKRLQSAGLVTRETHPRDERAIHVSLTDAGRALRERALDVPPQIMRRLGMGHDELEALERALATFIAASHEIDEPPEDGPEL